MNNEELVELYKKTDDEFVKSDIIQELLKINKGFLFAKLGSFIKINKLNDEEINNLFLCCLFGALKDLNLDYKVKFLTYLEYHCKKQRNIFFSYNYTNFSRYYNYIKLKECIKKHNITDEEFFNNKEYRTKRVDHFSTYEKYINYKNLLDCNSLDVPVSEDDSTLKKEKIYKDEDIEKDTIKKEIIKEFKKDIKKLFTILENSGEHLKCCILKEKLYNENSKTLKEIANKKGITVERVRQVERELLRDLRQNKYNINLIKYIGQL